MSHTDKGLDEGAARDLRLATHLRLLSRVSHATAHDIRTPLHTVVLYLELLRNTLTEVPGADPKPRQERQDRYVEVIRGELQRLEEMLEKLLIQTRVTEGRIERFDLVESLRDVIEFLEPYRRKERIQLRWEPPAGPVSFEGERDSVRQALVYLLVTAIEATPEGEELSVELQVQDGRAVIAMSGAGLGDWSAAVLAGAGEDGAFAVSRVVQHHRGSIKVRSGASSATTLEIHLPLGAAENG